MHRLAHDKGTKGSLLASEHQPDSRRWFSCRGGQFALVDAAFNYSHLTPPNFQGKYVPAVSHEYTNSRGYAVRYKFSTTMDLRSDGENESRPSAAMQNSPSAMTLSIGVGTTHRVAKMRMYLDAITGTRASQQMYCILMAAF